MTLELLSNSKKSIKRILTVLHRSILPLRALLQNWKKKLEINANLFVNICILNLFLYKNVKKNESFNDSIDQRNMNLKRS